MSNWEKYLEKIYFDPEHPASFEGPLQLYKLVKKEGKYKISHSQIKCWIQKQESYSWNKGIKRKFQRGRVIVAGIDDQFDADLASLISYADENNGYKCLLAVIDIFSCYTWVESLKDKASQEIVNAFDKILSEGRIPKWLRTDGAKDKGIPHTVPHSEKQANYVECFIKTIKSKIYRSMVERNSAQYIDILPKLVESYNRTWHSGIHSEPINVNKTNEWQLWWQMYWPKKPYIKKKRKKKQILYRFQVGDKVQTTYTQNPFQWEYDSHWTAGIFKIARRYMRQDQPIYTVVDWYDKPVEGIFYQKELQKVEALMRIYSK